MTVIPASWEAEVGELLEPGPGRQRLSRDVTTALQPGLQREILSQKKKKHLSKLGFELHYDVSKFSNDFLFHS